MLNRNAQYYEWLLPYLEGGLDDARRAQMESRLRDDPGLAAEADRLRRTVDGLRGAARRTPQAPQAAVPRDLWPRLRAQMEEPTKPVPAPARSAHGWWLTGVGATAAATLALAMVWLPGWHTPSQTDLHPVTMASPPVGMGRTAGPPPTPAAPPRAASRAPLPPNPTPPAKKPEKVPGPLNTAGQPPPKFTVADGSRPDPFALRPAPATTLNGMPTPSVKLASPPTAPTLNKIAANPRTRDGRTEAMPGAPPALFQAPVLMPAPLGQNPPALPPHPAPAAPAPNVSQVQNGGAVMNGARGASSTQYLTAQAQAGQTQAGQNQAEPQTKAQSHIFAMIPLTGLRSANPQEHGAQQDKMTAKRAASAPAAKLNNALNSAAQAQPLGGAFGGGGLSNNTFGGGGFGSNTQGGLDAWQSALVAAVQAPLWGDTLGEQQANQALLAAKEAGELDDLRARLEERRNQSPKDLVTGRMLAAVYEFGFSKESALHERRRVANLEGAVGEDWYALAQAEQQAGNSEAARAAYRRALECPVPPSPNHAGLARLRS